VKVLVFDTTLLILLCFWIPWGPVVFVVIFSGRVGERCELFFGGRQVQYFTFHLRVHGLENHKQFVRLRDLCTSNVCPDQRLIVNPWPVSANQLLLTTCACLVLDINGDFILCD
jgi:hypothetical protein